MADWIFQANPKHYDVVGALAGLDEIAWRVPQYTGEVRPGDRVFLWRSGADAGVVGIATVATLPSLSGVPDREQPYVLDSIKEATAETRVVLRVRSVDAVPKSAVAAVEELAEHKICTAPMGTVFPLDEGQSAVLSGMVGADFPAPGSAELPTDDWPSVFSWTDRRKDVYPMPGGADAQIKSLIALIELAAEKRPSLDEFVELIQGRFGSSSTNARYIGLFLRRMGFLDEVASLLEPSAIGSRLLAGEDELIAIAQLHQRARFVGEMLHELREPLSAAGLLGVANERYGMNWTTKAQITRRCGWLQSSGVITSDESGKFRVTKAGLSILERLTLHDALAPTEEVAEAASSGERRPPVAPAAAPSPTVEPPLATSIVEELTASSTDSSSPDRLEYAIAAAFRYLGFKATKLGGAGKTDVVADADLGRDDSYRVIIDGKTTARDAVADGQIDWDTIEEHRRQHEADHVVIVGPAFGGPRVSSRAKDHDVTLMTAEELGGLVIQHSTGPLDLDAYRELFSAGAGEVDLETLTETVEEKQRLIDIALSCVRQIEENSGDVGAMSARDLHLVGRADSELAASEAEIDLALEALTSPLIGALVRSERGFRSSSDRASIAHRLRILADALESPGEP